MQRTVNWSVNQGVDSLSESVLNKARVALVHEWLTPQATGGSELVVQEILNFIEADLYALIDFESTNPESYLFKRAIGTTFLQHLPFARRGVQKYLPLLPLAIEQLNLESYDIILSSSHTVAKGVLTRADQFHVCYCHAPMRFAWDMTFDYLRSSMVGHGLAGLLTRALLHQLRQWDVVSANRVDCFIANSIHTARRIWRCYRRPAEVVYPPVDTHRFEFNADKQDFYLTVSRLVSYKKTSLIVQAFNQLGRPLVIIGTGPELESIRRIANPNIQIMGWQPDSVVETYMANAKAFVYAACEDFGIAPVEAQSCGTPVIAYGDGGTAESVRGVGQWGEQGTGILFQHQTVTAIVDAVEQFEQWQHRLNPEIVRSHALSFSPAVFQQKYLSLLETCYQTFKSGTMTLVTNSL